MTILAGDIGGTKTRLALYEITGGTLSRRQSKQFESRKYPKFRDMVTDFLKEFPASIDSACFGVPGPVINGTVRATNLPWQLNETELSETTGIPRIKLVNDLVSTASAIPHFEPSDLLVIHEGKPGLTRDMTAVLAPGTGLGQAFLQFDGGMAKVIASEGGHSDFAPTREIEIELLKYLMGKFQRVSYERVLSGPGLVNIYSFLRDTDFAPESPEIAEKLKTQDQAATISAYGLNNDDPLCSQALDIFCSVLGAQAGNLVLNLMATGGVYLGGGIPPRIVQKITSGMLISSYLSKGRLSKIVSSTPLYLIRDDHASLLGAASIAMVELKDL